MGLSELLDDIVENVFWNFSFHEYCELKKKFCFFEEKKDILFDKKIIKS